MSFSLTYFSHLHFGLPLGPFAFSFMFTPFCFFLILSSFFLKTYPYNLSPYFLAYFIFKFLQTFLPIKSTVVIHSELHNSVINSFHHSSKRGRKWVRNHGSLLTCKRMDSSKHSNYDNKFFLNFFYAFIIKTEKYMHTSVKMIHINSQNPTLVCI